MKREEIFEMTKHLDEKYILEAAPAAKKKINFKKRIITFAVAAAITASLSVGAYAAYKAFNKKSVSEFYDSSAVSTMEKRGFGVGKTVDNGHFRTTLETAVKDDIDLRAVFTIEPLDDKAKEYLKEYKSPDFKVLYSDTGEFIEDISGILPTKQDDDEKSDETTFTVNLTLNYKQMKIDANRPLTIQAENLTDSYRYYEDLADSATEIVPNKKYDKLFDGLEFKLENLEKVKSADFYNEDGLKMYVSELTIAVPFEAYSQDVVIIGADGRMPDEIELHFKDGTVMSTYKDGMILCTSDYGDEIEELTVVEMRKFIDVDNLDYLVICGKTYKRK